MTERSVSVALRMKVRDYLAGGSQAIAMNKAIQASQRELGNESTALGRKLTGLAGDTEKLAGVTERSGKRMGRGALYGAAGIAALAASGGAIKVLPPLLAATATGAAALPGVLLGAASGAGVFKVAVSGVGDELKKVIATQDQFGRRLAPNAELLVSQYARLRPVLQGFQQGIQQRAFAGTAQGLGLLATKTLPQVSGGLNKIADDWSHLFAEIALTASSPEAVGAFNTITASADRFFDDITARIRPIGASISTLLMSSDPVARAFGDGLVAMIDRFNAAVERSRRTGNLQHIFEGGAQAAHELMSISEDILRITGMVVSEANKTNSATQDASASLRAYVASGRAAGDVAGIVHTLTVAWEGLRDVLGPIGELLRDALADPGVASSIQQTFALLGTGTQVLATVLHVILALNEASGGLLLPLIGLALASGKLTAAIDLTTAAAVRGSAALARYGAAGAKAGTMLEKGAAGAGKLLGALFALELIHQIFAGFDDAAADVDKLDASVKELAETGRVAGELTRVFEKGWGDMAAQAELATTTNWFGDFLRNAEEAVPLTGDIARLLGSPSFVQSADNFAALDTSMAKYANTTNDVKGATDAWHQVMAETGLDQSELQKLLPATAAELARLQTETHNLETGMAGAAERTKLLAAPLSEAVTLGRSLLDVFTELNGGSIGFAKAQIAAEAAVDQLSAGLDKNGLALNRQRDGFNINSEKGRANLTLTLQLAEAGAKAAQARKDEGGTITQAAAVYDQYIGRLRAALAVQGATPKQIDEIIGKYTEMPPSLAEAGAAANELNAKLSSIPKGTKFVFNGQSMIDGQGRALELGGSLKGLPAGKTFTWNGKNLVDSKGKVVDLQQAIQSLPPTKGTKVTVGNLDPTTGKVKGLAEELQGLPDGLASIRVSNGDALAAIRQVRQSLSNLNGSAIAIGNAHGGVYLPRQRGGVRKAAEGLLQPTIAGPGTRYQWAEPETGGELFLPRRGINVRRGRQLLDVAATWYGGQFVPTKAMRLGGYTAAAAGLVNVAPAPAVSETKATRLDYAEAYLRARDAVKALSVSLKENGRSFSLASVKGRENRSAVYAGIRAAQDAAKTRYEETGSVRLANKAYDEHIARLRATLAQQKVNAATIRGLLSVANRPSYGAPPAKTPANSSANVAYARALIAVSEGSGDLSDKLSLNQAGVGIGTDFGRENLGNILDFLGLAERAAQERYAQTKNAKLATTLYNAQVAELRKILTASGYGTGTINSLINTYGRITLTPNMRGGAYMAAAGYASLDKARVFGSTGSPMYGFAEPGTGGELFVPRNGERQRGRDLLSIGAGWYGGKFVAGNQPAPAASNDYSTHLTVHARQYTPTTAELLDHQRTIEAHARTGRRY